MAQKIGRTWIGGLVLSAAGLVGIVSQEGYTDKAVTRRRWLKPSFIVQKSARAQIALALIELFFRLWNHQYLAGVRKANSLGVFFADVLFGAVVSGGAPFASPLYSPQVSDLLFHTV